MPEAEVDIGPELVLRLLQAQHPDLAGRPLSLLANGWDNVMIRAGDDLLVRLPRRAAAVRLIENEQHWLPRLVPSLSLPVPLPIRTGGPGAGYPWPWSICRFIPGQIAAGAPLDGPENADVLGSFLGALHCAAPPDAPRNPYRGIPLAGRAATFTENLAVLGDTVDAAAVSRLWRAVLSAPAWEGPPLWLHGDLHPANLLVDAGRISGVIDFGDLTGGDPANDLSVIWMLFPPAWHPRFWQAWAGASGREPDDHLRARTLGWALALATVFLAHSADNPTMQRIGHSTLEAVLAAGPDA